MKYLLFLLLLKTAISFGSLSPYKANMWQSKDIDGVTLPYFSKSFLDELSKWDIKNWNVFIWGSGDCPTESTLFWLAKKCKKVTYVDWNGSWISKLEALVKPYRDKVLFKKRDIERKVLQDALFGLRSVNTLSDFGDNSSYVGSVSEDCTKYDCIIVDGHHRNTCVKAALNFVKPGGVIILNNSNQQTIGISSKKGYSALAKYKRNSFLHPGHVDWRTDYWVID